MTSQEVAAAMRRVANTIDKLSSSRLAKFPESMLKGETAVGAAAMLCYLRDLITTAGEEVYSREKLLVIFETVSRDAQIFPAGTGGLMWAMEDEDDE